jgi:hypothetical protein
LAAGLATAATAVAVRSVAAEFELHSRTCHSSQSRSS